MKKILLVICGCLTLSVNIKGQTTFNQQHYFGAVATFGNSIYVTDSCYYFSCLGINNIPPFDPGILFGKINHLGETELIDVIFDTNYTFENWFTPLIYNSSEAAFISMGSGSDSIGIYNYWMKISSEGQRLDTRFFRNAYFPVSPYTRVNDFLYHQFLDQYFVLSDSYIGENNLGLTPGYNTTITKLSAEGDSLNVFTYESPWDHSPQAIVEKGNQIVFGLTAGNYNITSLDLKYQTLIAALDTNLVLDWTWSSPLEHFQGIDDMLSPADSSLIIAGRRGTLYNINAETNYVAWDRGLVFKLNRDLEMEWETEFEWGGSNIDNRFTRIVEANDDSGYAMAGTVAYEFDNPPGGRLGFIAKINNEGDSLWTRRLLYYDPLDSIGYNHYVHDLQATPDNGYLMSGYTLDYLAETTLPRQRAWFIKVDSEGCLVPGCGVVDTEEPTETGPALVLYPNPVAEHLNVYMGDNGDQKWRFLLLDTAGKQLGNYAAPTSHTTYMLPVQDYPGGTYYLQVIDEYGQQLKTYKWIKI